MSIAAGWDHYARWWPFGWAVFGGRANCRQMSTGAPTSAERERSAESTAVAVTRADHGSVSVQKAIDLTGTGDTIQDAVSEALDRARLSLEGITSFEVQRISGAVEGSRTAYSVELRVWFTLLERMHG